MKERKNISKYIPKEKKGRGKGTPQFRNLYSREQAKKKVEGMDLMPKERGRKKEKGSTK